MSEACKYCFIPDEKDVFKVAEVVSFGDVNEDVTVQDLVDKKRVTIKKALIVPIGSMSELENPPSDLIKLIHVHRPGILHTLKTRFMKDCIYTSIGPILVVLNPFKWIAGVYEEDIMRKYKLNERNLSEDPHVFATAQEAYSDLVNVKLPLRPSIH